MANRIRSNSNSRLPAASFDAVLQKKNEELQKKLAEKPDEELAGLVGVLCYTNPGEIPHSLIAEETKSSFFHSMQEKLTQSRSIWDQRIGQKKSQADAYVQDQIREDQIREEIKQVSITSFREAQASSSTGQQYLAALVAFQVLLHTSKKYEESVREYHTRCGVNKNPIVTASLSVVDGIRAVSLLTCIFTLSRPTTVFLRNYFNEVQNKKPENITDDDRRKWQVIFNDAAFSSKLMELAEEQLQKKAKITAQNISRRSAREWQKFAEECRKWGAIKTTKTARDVLDEINKKMQFPVAPVAEKVPPKIETIIAELPQPAVALEPIPRPAQEKPTAIPQQEKQTRLTTTSIPSPLKPPEQALAMVSYKKPLFTPEPRVVSEQPRIPLSIFSTLHAQTAATLANSFSSFWLSSVIKALQKTISLQQMVAKQRPEHHVRLAITQSPHQLKPTETEQQTQQQPQQQPIALSPFAAFCQNLLNDALKAQKPGTSFLSQFPVILRKLSANAHLTANKAEAGTINHYLDQRELVVQRELQEQQSKMAESQKFKWQANTLEILVHITSSLIRLQAHSTSEIDIGIAMQKDFQKLLPLISSTLEEDQIKTVEHFENLSSSQILQIGYESVLKLTRSLATSPVDTASCINALGNIKTILLCLSKKHQHLQITSGVENESAKAPETKLAEQKKAIFAEGLKAKLAEQKKAIFAAGLKAKLAEQQKAAFAAGLKAELAKQTSSVPPRTESTAKPVAKKQEGFSPFSKLLNLFGFRQTQHHTTLIQPTNTPTNTPANAR